MKTYCRYCKGLIPEKRARCHAVYCSKECERSYYAMRYHDHNPHPGKCAGGTTGAISELRVSADLLYKGYSVFRALSPNCLCDLAILKGDKLLRVEVKTTCYSPKGSIVYPKPRNDCYDILALVLDDKIIYKPALETVP